MAVDVSLSLPFEGVCEAEEAFGAGGLAPVGVQIPPPAYCPDRSTSRIGKRGYWRRKKPYSWELPIGLYEM